MPHVVVIEHEDDDPAYLFGDWLREAGASVTQVRAHHGEPLPDGLDGVDALLVMGGEMGANDDAEHAWLSSVKALFREAAQRRTPTLGICLGHQLAAVAFGGEVSPNPAGKQLGLLDVGWEPDAAADPLLGAVATPRRALQWNDDVVVRLPESAVRLATAPGGEVQAARYAATVWGVQWHPEVDETLVAGWLAFGTLPEGADPVAELDALRDARDELDAAWRPLAERLVALAAGDVAAGEA